MVNCAFTWAGRKKLKATAPPPRKRGIKRAQLESFLKEQPKNRTLLADLALTNMGLGDKADALAITERAIAANPIEQDALDGPGAIEILARVSARAGDPDRAIAASQKLLSMPYLGPLASYVRLTPALLRLDPMFAPGSAHVPKWLFIF